MHVSPRWPWVKQVGDVVVVLVEQVFGEELGDRGGGSGRGLGEDGLSTADSVIEGAAAAFD